MKKLIRIIAAAALTSVLFVSSANATLILRLSDGESTVTTTDLDLDGAVLYVGSIGDWVLNITVGVASPLIGDDNTSRLDLSSLNVTGSSETGGTLYISLTDTGNTVPLGDTQYLVEFGGTTDGSISFQSYVDSSNTAFGTETLLYDTGAISGGAFSGSGYGDVSVSGPYSITTTAMISHESGWSVSGFNNGVTIPEPGSLALIGIGLLSLAFGIKKVGRRS
jgi:PEP-CTERM motif